MNIYQIKHYLRKSGITYEELSQKSGVDKTLIGIILNGREYPRIETLEKIFNALDLDITEFEEEEIPSRLYNLTEWKRAKKEKKLRFTDIAELSGIPLSTVNDAFSGRTHSPRIDTIIAIAKVLGLTKDMEKEREKIALKNTLSFTESEKKILFEHRALSEDERELLKAYRLLIPSMKSYALEMIEKLGESVQAMMKNKNV